MNLHPAHENPVQEQEPQFDYGSSLYDQQHDNLGEAPIDDQIGSNQNFDLGNQEVQSHDHQQEQEVPAENLVDAFDEQMNLNNDHAHNEQAEEMIST